MKELIKKIRGFKIVPEKFKSSTIFDVQEYLDDCFKVELYKTEELDLDDYKEGSEIEIFGLGEEGLTYFITEIVSKEGNKLKIKYPERHKNIQRREYSRVDFKGSILLKELPNAKITPVDLSAGGLKFISDVKPETEKIYHTVLKLDNNLDIKCEIETIKIFDCKDQKNKYDVRARFSNLESVDRIALIQYSFKVLLENETK